MSFKEVFFNELKLIFSDVAIVITIFAGVILYSFLYPQPYTSQSVSELPLSVVDMDRSDTSRDIIFKLDATPQISVKRVDLSEIDAKEALLASKVKAILIIPKNFKKDLASSKSPTIAFGGDASYFLIYGGVLEGTMKSILTTSATIQVANLLKKQVPLSKAKLAYTPYALNIINIFNPQNSYIQYVIPAVFVLILQQTLLIGLGILGGGINEKMSKGEKGYFIEASTWMMMLSRVIIFGSIFFIHILFYFGFSFEMFGVSHVASISELLSFSFVFLLAVISFGLFIGALFSSREMATPLVLFSSLPLVFTASFVWPIEALPQALVYISILFPSTPAIEGFLRLNQMGASFDMIINLYAILWIQTIIYFSLAYFLINHKKHLLKN